MDDSVSRSRRRPTLSLYIPQTPGDTVLEENRTPRPRSTKTIYSAYRALKSPASQNHRLPVENLTEIFLYCLPTIYDIPPPCLTNQAPLSLTSVCREWRLVALNTPRLWSSPHIRLPQPKYMSSMDSKRQSDGIELWFKRSGSSLPLSLQLMLYHEMELSDRCWEEPHPNSLKLIHLLMKHSHRFTHLGICSLQTLRYLVHSLSTMSTIALPALKSIYIHLVAPERDVKRGEVLADFISYFRTSMPSLQELCMDGLTPGVARYLTKAHSWSSNFTQLILSSSFSSSSRHHSIPKLASSNGYDLGPSDILSILSQNPQLRSFQAIITLHTHRACTSFATLPFLTSLGIRFKLPPNDALIPYPDQDIYRFFERLSCPALRTLSVTYAGVPSLTEVPFISWLSAPFCQYQNRDLSEPSVFEAKSNTRVAKLRELKLEVSMTPGALTTCLILLPPSVRVLEIVDLGQIDIEGAGVMFGHTVQDSHLELLTRQTPKPNSINQSVSDVNAPTSFVERGYDVCPHLKTFRLIVSGFLTLSCSTPTPRSSTSTSDFNPLIRDWKRKVKGGVSRAALHGFIESRKHSSFPTAGSSSRKRVLRECEVLLSPSLATYYMLDSSNF
ncbi:hypothetical protein DFJ43DRAFT_554693 [Lentinula guzmanii]|uniref:F-box domain-containing protein n=1 Tax=Lentinula guzmanii TaxID=2804957 RepID=A0AA38JJ21_9AGAR|nr:hypothetical protein DFJ43DRAFT_554693 [Lentinula guzmanii]